MNKDSLWTRSLRLRRDWYLIACQTTSASTAPRTPRRTCCPYAYVLITVLLVSRSCELFSGMSSNMRACSHVETEALGYGDRETTSYEFLAHSTKRSMVASGYEHSLFGCTMTPKSSTQPPTRERVWCLGFSGLGFIVEG